MLNFESDYTTGCCPEILKALTTSNFESASGYGKDIFCQSAEEKIKKACNKMDAQVEFIVGGTQTNLVVISSMLNRYEAVIAAKTGHISCHEAGAIEYSGHKVIELEQKLGKLDSSVIRAYLENFYNDESSNHMVQPGMVYISQPTEYGTLYSLNELKEISSLCKQYNILLFIDGARLGYALKSKFSDVSLEDLAQIADVFYIGGTKVGALCGEAVVFTHNNKPKYFETMKKQSGALLAKGRLLGIQFDTLFTDNLYFRISEHAIKMAERLKEILSLHNLKFLLDSPTNQQFVIMENDQIKRLRSFVKFNFWEAVDKNHSAVRFATSWSTTEEDLDNLKAILEKEL